MRWHKFSYLDIKFIVPHPKGPTLVTWIGRTDLNAVTRPDEAGLGPIGQAVAAREFERVDLLCDYPAEEGVAYLRWSAPQNRFATEDLLDPTLCPTLQECLGAAGFVVVGLRSAFELAPRQVYLTATVENLSNAAYRVVGSGILGPGLSGQVGLEGTY